MNDSTIKGKSLEELDKILDDMLELQDSLDDMSKDALILYGRTLPKVQQQILRLRTERLQFLIDEFEKQAPALKKAINKVEKTRQTIEDIETYLKAVTAFVNLIADILRIATI